MEAIQKRSQEKNNTKNDAKRNKNLEEQYKFFQLKFLQNTKIKVFFDKKFVVSIIILLSLHL